jgi:hypothetical protein
MLWLPVVRNRSSVYTNRGCGRCDGTLFESRAALITNDEDLRKAGDSVVRLVSTMMDEAHRRGFHMLHEVDLNEALFNLHPLFPFTE